MIVVPRFTRPSVSTPMPVYEATPRSSLAAMPDLLPAPRGSFVFGVDDSAAVYLESYGAGPAVLLQLRDRRDSLAWSGTAVLTRGTSSGSTAGMASGFASAVVRVPLTAAGMGLLTLTATRAGRADTTRAALFLGFGPDLPVVSFGQMLSYLRFFASPERLKALRTAPPARRGAMWSEFLRSTDPDPSTPRNEALEDYFVRIRDANDTFRGDVRGGWLSDRGMVYVGLGSPAAAYEQYGNLYMPGDISSGNGGRARLLIWEYPDIHARVVFYDQMDSGLWRFTQQSASVFPSLLFRRLSH